MKPTFRNFLSTKRYEKSTIGDLARDVKHDPFYPKEDDFDIWYRHLTKNDACNGAIEALEKAWKEYEIWLSANS